MKIIIDRDSICMGDDFSHQTTIECSENETIESLMNKIIQTNFFPVEDLKYLAKKWELNVSNNKILTFFPNNNKVKYCIDKKTFISNCEIKYIYFKAIKELYISEKHTKKDFLLLILFICLLCFNIAIIIIPIFYFLSMRNDEFDTCLDTGICKSGIEINTIHGKIKIDKQSCLKYNWEWVEDKNACYLNNE